MPELAYILAASHSGSTLLAMLLNTHPEVCTGGELKATDFGDAERYRCSCGELVKQCHFWARVSREMARRGISFDITNARTDIRLLGSAYARRLLAPLPRGAVLEWLRDAALSLSPTWRSGLPENQERNAALVSVLVEISGSRIVVDSSKSSLRLKYLLRNTRLQIKVIHLIRDGRAVALTYMDAATYADAADPALRGGGSGAGRKEVRVGIRDAAYVWCRNNEAAESVLATLDPVQWIDVRYEELCAAPDATLGRIFGFLGVSPERPARGFRSVEHHVLGNGMRLDSGEEIRLDDRWRSVLSRRELQVFNAVAGEVNRRCGYE